MAAWLSPTGFVDSGSHWDRTNTLAACYDENTGTYCNPDPVASPGDWCPYAEFTHSAIACDKIRYYVQYFTEIDLDCYYDSGWHDVYAGAAVNGEWVEKDIPSAPQTITAFRIRGTYTGNVYGRQIKEVDFGYTGYVETLRPESDEGTNEATMNPANSDHYTCVDEAESDGNTTYLYTDSTNKVELFNLPAHSVGSGTINKISVFNRVAQGGAHANGEYGVIYVKMGGTLYDSGSKNWGPTTVYDVIYHDWTENPNTSSAWTWDNIDALIIGGRLWKSNQQYRVTQI